MMLFLENLLKPDLIQSRRRSLSEESPLIIMSRGKSGTRLLTWACQKLGYAMGASERVPTADLDDRRFRQTIKKLALCSMGVVRAADIPPGKLHYFQKEAARLQGLLKMRPEAKHGWGWKWPETYLVGPYLQATFPKARYLHLVRDGRDLAFKTHLTDDPHRALGKALLKHIGALDQPRILQAARSWAFQVERYQAFAENLPPAHNLEMRYEALCENPVREMQRVADFMGVPLNDACRDYVAGHVSVGEVGQFRTADPEKIRQVETAIGPTLDILGYSQDSDN